MNYIYNIYFALIRIRSSRKEKVITRKIISFIIIFLKRYSNVFIKYYYKMTMFKKLDINHGEEKQKKVIVTLTSFPDRINFVWITIESIFRQSYKPDKVILWLSKEQFKNKKIPRNLLRQRQKGLEILFCDDLKPHKKYYYTFKKYPDDIIITVDDDVIYPKNTLEELIKLNEIYPSSICCNRGHIMKKDTSGNIAPYNTWSQNPSGFIEPTLFLCPTGVSGVLYPPKTIDKEVFNKKSIKDLCLYADDLWLKTMSLRKGTKVVKTSAFPGEFFTIGTSQKTALFDSNVNQNKNDLQLKAIQDKYTINLPNT